MLPIIVMGMKMCPRLLMSPGLEVASNPRVNTDKFSHLFVECVEDVLTDLLGARVREGLLDYMARYARLARTDLLEHPSELSKLLEKSLDRGGIEVEKCIMRRLCAILEWKYEEPSNFNFADQVEEARGNWKTASSTHPLSQ